MLRRGFAPTIDLITEVEGDGRKAEIAYIKWLRSKGIDLWNGAGGGGGGGLGKDNAHYGKRHTVRQRQKWRKDRTGKGNSNYGNHVLKGRKRPEHSKWMTEHNPFAGKHHKETSKQKARDTIKRTFADGRIGYWKGKDPTTSHNKEMCRCCSCMSKRGLSYKRRKQHG